jgi:hypothetical protein
MFLRRRRTPAWSKRSHQTVGPTVILNRRAEGQKVLVTSPARDEASAPDVRRAPRSGAHNRSRGEARIIFALSRFVHRLDPVVIGGLNRQGRLPNGSRSLNRF